MGVKLVGWLAIVVLLFTIAPRTTAQINTTGLVGEVKDKSGAAVKGAQVKATNTATNLSRDAETNEQGEYRIDFLPVGAYTVEITVTGFKKFVQKGVVLEVTQDGRVDATMEVGSVTETVSVTAEPPLVNTTNAELGRTVENKEITDLPIVNRNVYTLLDLTAGVQSNANSIVLGYPEQRTIINGGVDGGAGSVNYYLDGGTNMTGLRNTGNILPNPDAIQEFRVETSNYGVEYGRFSGGVVTVVTKSGSNEFHGSAFEFVRNNILNANTFDNIITPSNPKPPLHRNQFGGTIGGPIRKNKTFFFFSYDGLRQISSIFLNGARVPTAAERMGDFSADAPIFDPTTGKQFTCNGKLNVICMNRFDPVVTNILAMNLIPQANVGTNAWQGSIPSPFNTDEFLAKLDQTLTPRQQLSISYFETSINNIVQAGSGNLPWSDQQFTARQQNADISHTWNATSNTVNQFWLIYTRNFGGRLNLPQTSLGNLGSSFLIQGTPSLPQISVSGFFSLTQAIAGPLAGSNFYSIRDVLSTTHGRHTLEFGGEVSLDKDIQATLLNNYGVFTFSAGKTTGALPLPSTGNALADFFLGLPSAVAQDAPVTPLTNSWSPAVFGQDTFRITPRFTLSVGLRWDVQTPPTDPQNRESTFIFGEQSLVRPTAPLGLVFPGDAGVTRGIIPVRWNHFSPRLGIAWDPFGDGKTSIRAGGGVFWGSTSGNNWNMTSNFEPFAIRLNPFANVGIVNVNGVNMQGATLSNPYQNYPGGTPFPYNGSFVAGGSVLGVAPNFQYPYTIQTNASVSRQFTSDFSLQVAFVGTYTHDLAFADDANYPMPCSAFNPVPSGCGSSGSSVLARRPIDNTTLGKTASPFGSVFIVRSNQTASYNGLQVTANKRLKNHLMLNAFYTYSHTLDSVELQNNTTNPTAAGQIPQDYTHLNLERGPADFDLRHQFVASLIWQLDYYGGSNRYARGFLDGWSVSPIIKYHSGLPFTVTTGKDNNQDGQSGNDRPNLVGDPNSGSCTIGTQTFAVHTAQCWFNTSAFVANAVGADGNVGRNSLYGPSYWDVDLAIFKDVHLTERIVLQVRGEASNAFNIVSLNNPTSSLSSTPSISSSTGMAVGLGTISSANPMRQIQLGMRLTF